MKLMLLLEGMQERILEEGQRLRLWLDSLMGSKCINLACLQSSLFLKNTSEGYSETYIMTDFCGNSCQMDL